MKNILLLSSNKNSAVKANDILLNITGASLGRSCVVPDSFIEGNVNQHVCIIRVNRYNCPYFLQPFLSSFNGQKLMFQRQTGSGREGLNFQSIRGFRLLLPPLPEQQKIAAFLTAVDNKLKVLRKKKALLEQYKKGVMQRIFSREIRFKDKNGKDFPEWEKKRGKDLFKSYSNKNHNGDLPVLSASQEHGMVHRDTNGIRIQSSLESIKSYKIVEKGDFVISLRSFQGGIEYSDLRGLCSPAYIVLKPKVKIDNLFFKFYFKKESFIERLSKTVVGIRDGKQISYEAFGGLNFSVPSFQEQYKIANFLTAIDKKIASVEVQIEKTGQWKKGLLQRMFV